VRRIICSIHHRCAWSCSYWRFRQIAGHEAEEEEEKGKEEERRAVWEGRVGGRRVMEAVVGDDA
jgi:hypothetical protein